LKPESESVKSETRLLWRKLSGIACGLWFLRSDY
jgi:hypothetical protein